MIVLVARIDKLTRFALRVFDWLRVEASSVDLHQHSYNFFDDEHKQITPSSMFSRGAVRTATGAAQCLRTRHAQPSRFVGLPSRASAIFQQHGQRRTASTMESFRKVYRQQPILVSVALAIITVSGGFFLYIPFYYEKYQVRPYHNFPEEVAKELRKAVYYQHTAVEPKKAFQHFKLALQVAEEIGMDPFSPEILGTKIRLAAFLEQYNDYEAAIKVLGIIRSDCVKWNDKLGDKHFTDGKRTRVLQTAVKVSLKMGELYGLPYVGEREKSEEALVWAVDTALREEKRREVEGVKEGEGQWLGKEEMGAVMETLAHLYEARNMPGLAAPLFLKALLLCSKPTCHAVVLMNNLASTFATIAKPTPPSTTPPSKSVLNLISPRAPPPGTMQQRLPDNISYGPTFALHDPSSASPSENVNPEIMTPADQASSWARSAVSMSEMVPAELRNAECDQAKCAALYNLGELAERQGRQDFAVDWYRQADQVARSIDFEEGVKLANEALKRLNKS